MPKLNKKNKSINPARTIALSFILVIIIGTILLMLPISSRDGTVTDVIDSLFTATSATCVTGLVVFETYQHWSFFGQSVILLMIQVGGLGIVTFVTFFNFAIGRKLGLRRMQLASESVNYAGFNDTGYLMKNIIKISLITELIGALVLMTVFVPQYGPRGVFKAIFISISAFCNAGFDILGEKTPFVSLMDYSSDPVVLVTVMLLIICGGVGFIVWHDLINYRKTKHLELHTKLVLLVTAMLVISGAAIVFALEYNNSLTLGEMSFGNKVLNSFFQSVTFRTAGFNTVDIGSFNPITKVFAIIFMYIGAAPGSTGGGIKITTVVVIVMTVVSVLRNKNETTILKRRIDKSTIYKSLTIVMLSLTVISISAMSIYVSIGKAGNASAVDTLFECVSAFATVGLSAGVTSVITLFGQFVLIFLMFLGRVGPISVILFLIINSDEKSKKQVIPEAKIMVG